jgi:DNA-binding transcriptional ArsR family regulator
MPTKRREATPEEFKAMAHPLRLRILRLCYHDELTNKQIAERLGKDPATVLHHVRLLVEHGFLRAEKPRTGARGALEKPYRATGKSWHLSIDRFPADQRLASELAMVDAFRAELVESGSDSLQTMSRLGPKLSQASADELKARIEAMVEELAERGDEPDGDRYGLFVALHKRA